MLMLLENEWQLEKVCHMQVMQGSAVYFQLVQFDCQEMSNSCEIL
jgi:hypothetical protein